MPERLVFHESFDSTRATAGYAEDHPNLAQSQAEAVMSLLLGRSLSVNHTYAFDSRGMLELADVVLDTWEEAKRRNERAERAANRLAGATPFVLHRFRQPTFLAACSSQLRLSDPNARQFFKLSAWERIDQLPAVREDFATLLDRGQGSVPTTSLPAEIRQDPQLARHVDTLLRLNGYFDGYNRSREAVIPQIALREYVERLITLSPQQVATLATGHDCPEDTALRLQSAVREKVTSSEDGAPGQQGANAVNRGWVHGGADLAELDQLLADQLRELVDTLYNAVLAESAKARFEYMSSIPRVDGRDEMKHVNAFALALVQDTRLAKGDPSTSSDQPRSLRMAGMFAAAEAVPNLSVAPLRKVFEAYWELMADDDAVVAWEDSGRELDRLVRLDRPVDQELEEAWESHLAQLRATLPHVVTADNGRLAVPVASGHGGLVQTMAPGGLSAEDLDRSLAAGEYLGDLARSFGASEDRSG